MSIKVETSKCPQNHRCPSIRVCPTGALSQKRYEAPKVDESKCINCGKCIFFCPFAVFEVEK